MVTAPLHCETIRDVAASPKALFDYLDDHARLASHMTKSSWMMAGSRMTIELDAAQGRAVGSKISLKGRFLGLPLAVDEAVREHRPPFSKTWETIGEPRLIIIGPYRMGFDITPKASQQSSLRVWLHYQMPSGVLARSLAKLLAGPYARWCTESMADDAAAHFRP